MLNLRRSGGFLAIMGIALLAHSNTAAGDECTVSCCSGLGCFWTITGDCSEVNCRAGNHCGPFGTCVEGACTAPAPCCHDHSCQPCCLELDPVCCAAIEGQTVPSCGVEDCQCTCLSPPDAECNEEEIISSEAPEPLIDTPAATAAAEPEPEPETGSGGWLTVLITVALFLAVVPFVRSRYRRRD